VCGTTVRKQVASTLSSADEKEAENRLGKVGVLRRWKVDGKETKPEQKTEAVAETCSVSRELKGKGRKQASAEEVQ
jgi:hypothetical protein